MNQNKVAISQPMQRQRMKRKQREIIRRVIVRGLLVLESPTCLSSGDADSPTDMPLMRDSILQRALLTGASIAGALRNYLREYEHNYGTNGHKNDLATSLFGGMRQDDDGNQSPLIVHDAVSSRIPHIELRDGVKIDGKTGTAEENAKYDLELLEAGTEFPLQFELLIEQNSDSAQTLINALAIALKGLENAEISLGMKKRRGFGQCQVKKWQVWNFDLTQPSDRLQWLTYQHWVPGLLPNDEIHSDIVSALRADLSGVLDRRDRFTIQAEFSLDGSLLIRSGQADIGRSPDVVHLKSHRNQDDGPVAVLSGTSLAGVLRHRAERIINTIHGDLTLVDSLFGFVDKNDRQAQSSRLIVYETEIQNSADLVQTRIAIDRFTGGALHGALFDEQPVFGDKDTTLSLSIELRQPQEAEIGLLLLLLKDLWTSDLSVGGGSSIGRGRLQGKEAVLEWHKPENHQKWRIKQSAGPPARLQISDQINTNQSEDAIRATLETYVQALNSPEMQEGQS
ncbi:MAG: RAMP superfamily CRISPR-associated protein [Cyanobacteria bacterium P01_F01_bin.150]